MRCLVCAKSDGRPLKHLEGATNGFHEACYQELLSRIRAADVIVVIDRNTGAYRVVYGTLLLELTAGRYEGSQGIQANILRVPVDFGTDDIELIAALCKVEKGHHDE